jgi:2-hydroxychromene-2-carboxylate isomerase
MRIALALEGDDRIRFSQAVFGNIWSGAVDPRRPDWLQQVIAMQKLPQAWLSRQNDQLDEMTKKALDAGAFGAPTFLLHQNTGRPELFFGLDHMDFLARACEARSAQECCKAAKDSHEHGCR